MSGLSPWEMILSGAFVGGYVDIVDGTVILRCHITLIQKCGDNMNVFVDFSVRKDTGDPEASWECENTYVVVFPMRYDPVSMGEGRFKITVPGLGTLVLLPRGWLTLKKFNPAMVKGIDQHVLERV